ncbi:MAG: zinc ribbon domain-containing protein [Candidatus Hodarchaeota archaeon]
MRKSDQLICIGLVVLVSGLAILAGLLLNQTNFTFFVFPFFFFGNVDLPILILINAVFIGIFLIFLRMLARDGLWNEMNLPYEKTPVFLRVKGICDYCGEPIPEKASFCPSCGSTANTKQFQ